MEDGGRLRSMYVSSHEVGADVMYLCTYVRRQTSDARSDAGCVERFVWKKERWNRRRVLKGGFGFQRIRRCVATYAYVSVPVPVPEQMPCT